MSSELPIRAVVVKRFDLGFILKDPNGRLGQLRVLEMSATMFALDQSSELSAGVGSELDVYIIKESEGTYLFSEFSGAERAERERQAQLAIEARGRAQIGQRLAVTVIQKGDWGCICHEINGLLEGFVLSRAILEKNGWCNPEMPAASRTGGATDTRVSASRSWLPARNGRLTEGTSCTSAGSIEYANA